MPDGRTLEVHEHGDPQGFPVVAHHGTPASGLLYERWNTPGVRLIGYDRAGYGGSTRNHGRDVSSIAADVLALADALGLERFATWGISGGGPHALACAALCGDRLTAAASLAGIAPYGAEGLDWLGGMGEDNVHEFGLVLEGEHVLAPSLAADRTAMLAASPEDLFATVETLLGAADRAALTGALAEFLHAITVHGLEHGVDGWTDDDLAFAADWGFDPAAITRPVLIVQGGDDRFVPRAHGEWLAAHVPGCEAWIDDENGHLTLFESRVGDVHEWLLSHS
jgi:pimeloyl-ACP methyl ester carboxylesterase